MSSSSSTTLPPGDESGANVTTQNPSDQVNDAAIQTFDFPDPTPPALAHVLLIFCCLPMLILVYEMKKRRLFMEAAITLGVFVAAIIQGVVEIHNKSECWYQQTCLSANGLSGGAVEFDWQQILQMNVVIWDFFQWQNLLMHLAIMLICLVLIHTMQHEDRNVDHLLSACYIGGIAITTLMGRTNNHGFVGQSILPVGSCAILSLAKGSECLRGKLRLIKKLDLIRGVIMLILAGWVFTMQNTGADRQKSLLRPWYCVYILTCSLAGVYWIRAFEARGYINQRRQSDPDPIQGNIGRFTTRSGSRTVTLTT